MKNTILRMGLEVLLAVGVMGFMQLGHPVTVLALTPNQKAVCDAIGSGTDCVETDDQGGTKVDSVIKTIVKLLGFVAGMLAVIMIIVSGIKYVTSGGDSNKIASAKNTLVYAIVGIIIVALSQVIVRFVLGQTAKSTIQCATGQVVDVDGKCADKN
jgi:type IV secretory pathway VirB2 component (pilin)